MYCKASISLDATNPKTECACCNTFSPKRLLFGSRRRLRSPIFAVFYYIDSSFPHTFRSPASVNPKEACLSAPVDSPKSSRARGLKVD
jgi:hypothetical protein